MRHYLVPMLCVVTHGKTLCVEYKRAPPQSTQPVGAGQHVIGLVWWGHPVLIPC
jgi:hypothetical protein